MDVAFRVLVTGFTPFGGAQKNMSGEGVRELGKRGDVTVLGPEGHTLIARLRIEILDVLWSMPAKGHKDAQVGAADRIDALIEEMCPDIVLATGEGITENFIVEQQARDRDARIRDNKDRRPRRRRREFPSDPESFSTSLPVWNIWGAWMKAGIHNFSPSSDAGSFICEDVFYRVMRAAQSAARRANGLRILRAGLIHTPDPDKNPVSTSKIADAFEIAIAETMLDVAPSEYPGGFVGDARDEPRRASPEVGSFDEP
jgi:pyroglutamyl-peptidase